MKWVHVLSELDRHIEQRRDLCRRLEAITKELKSIEELTNEVNGKP